MIKPTSQIDCLRYVVTALHEMGCGTKLWWQVRRSSVISACIFSLQQI